MDMMGGGRRRLPRHGLLTIDTIPLTINGQWIYLYY